MDKEDEKCTHTHTHTHTHTEYYSAMKKRMTNLSFATSWMDPEDIIFSEIRQRKTSTAFYHLYVESKK